MKRLIFGLFLTSATWSLLQAQDTVDCRYKGDYLGKKPPGLVAAEFDAGELTGDLNSFNFSFSPDGLELFFSYVNRSDSGEFICYEIKHMKRIGEGWSEPQTAFFSGKHSDVDVTFSPDGQMLFFASDRRDAASENMDIYYIEKKSNGWSEPIFGGEEVGSKDGSEVHACLSNKGNLFFRSNRPGGYGHDDIYKASYVNGAFQDVVNMGPKINTAHMETDCFVAPDESFLLFNTRRPEDDNLYKIYVSFQLEEGNWSKAVPLGEEVTSIYGAIGSTLTPDGKYLLFSSRRGDKRAKYWISTEVIEKLRPVKITVDE